MCHASSHETDSTCVAGNLIHDNGYLALASAFKSCTKLTILNLYGVNIVMIRNNKSSSKLNYRVCRFLFAKLTRC